MAIKRHYCVAVISEDTGEVEHMAVGDAPLTDAQIPGTRGANDHLHYFEFETTGQFIRAGAVMAMMEVGGATSEDRQKPTAEIKLRSGQSLDNFNSGRVKKRD